MPANGKKVTTSLKKRIARIMVANDNFKNTPGQRDKYVLSLTNDLASKLDLSISAIKRWKSCYLDNNMQKSRANTQVTYYPPAGGERFLRQCEEYYGLEVGGEGYVEPEQPKFGNVVREGLMVVKEPALTVQERAAAYDKEVKHRRKTDADLQLERESGKSQEEKQSAGEAKVQAQ